MKILLTSFLCYLLTYLSLKLFTYYDDEKIEVYVLEMTLLQALLQ